ncbi:hypothetical protein [Streptomyces sp. NPDC001135]
MPAVRLWRWTRTRHVPVLAGPGFAAGDVALTLPGRVAFAGAIAFFPGARPAGGRVPACGGPAVTVAASAL